MYKILQLHGGVVSYVSVMTPCSLVYLRNVGKHQNNLNYRDMIYIKKSNQQVIKELVLPGI